MICATIERTACGGCLVETSLTDSSLKAILNAYLRSQHATSHEKLNSNNCDRCVLIVKINPGDDAVTVVDNCASKDLRNSIILSIIRGEQCVRYATSEKIWLG